jgi:3-phosphoshikimate 1-carboxyvinyltransferase
MSASPKSMTVAPCRRLRGELEMPGDKSISHRLAMLCGSAKGRSVIRNYLQSGDCLATLRAMQSLGASPAFKGGVLEMRGNGGRMLEPVGPLDLGNSGTGIRLMTGLLAGSGVEATLTGDESVRSRPMGRIHEPLLRMGAAIELKGEGGRAPIAIHGRELKGIAYDLPVASAQVKSCILLAGLRATGTTTVRERVETRDHTERLFKAMMLPVRVDGLSVSLDGAGPSGPALQGGKWHVPGDISSAAFWLVAAAAKEGADVTIRHLGLNPRRTAVLDVLVRMGADVRIEPEAGSETWEPVGDVTIRGGPLRGTTIGGAEIPNLIDELPILAVAGALAQGETVIRDAAELRVKESDRIATTAAGLREMGVEVEERPDGITVRGGCPLRASDGLKSHGDHRIAMALAVLSLFAPGASVVHDIACVDTSYPGFWADLKKLVK